MTSLYILYKYESDLGVVLHFSCSLKMLRVVLVSVLALVLFAEAAKYTTKYDNIDLDEILSNDRLLNNYVDCLLKDGKEAKCSPDGAELKSKYFRASIVR